MKSLQKSNVYIVSLGIFVGAFAAALLVSSSFTPAENSSADTIFAELSGTGYTASVTSADIISLNLNTTPSGATITAKDTINTKTNAPNGYKLYLSSNQYTDYDSTHPGNALYQDGNSTSSYFISPATGTISSPANLTGKANSWGASLTGDLGDFFAIPLKSSPAILTSKSSATNDTGDDLDIYYGIYANTALPSGTYIGTVNYTVLPEASYSAVDTAALHPTVIDAEAHAELTISTSLYTNYSFTGEDIIVKISKDTEGGTGAEAMNELCGVQTIDTSTGALAFTCIAPKLSAGTYDVTVNIPKFNKTYTLSQALTYYTVPEFFKISNMQEMTSDICNSATTPAVDAAYADTTGTHTGDTSYVPQRVLYDIRDGNSYRIRKLADGNCWMTENLDLALTEGLELNPDNTDIGETWVVAEDEVSQTEPGTKWGTGDAWNDTAHITGTELNTVHSYNGNGSAGSRTIATNKGNTTLATDGSNAVSPVETQSIGTYYNWYAATAKSGTADLTSGNALYSICPRGWKLPDNDGTKSFKNLLFAYYGLSDNSAASNGKVRSYPLSFVYSGNYTWVSGTVGSQSTRGNWWSSTALGRASAYDLHINYDPRLLPQNNFVRTYGFSVRCISR